MYKTQLQEICHQRLWSLPTYTSNRDGPDHCPRFRASVIVNGVSFDSSDFCKSSKEAQNEAAKIAFQRLSSPTIVAAAHSHRCLGPSCSSHSSAPSSIVISSASNSETLVVKNEISSNSSIPGNSSGVILDREFADVNYIYKSQLQNYAQKRGLSLPVYSCIREGPPHALHFKATVTVDGRTFESPVYFTTLKEAEHAAAKAALSSLSMNGIQEDDCGLFKNLLQELAKKEGFSIPIYTTNRSGAPHVPTFSSSVEIEGDVFHGVEAKTKKQAEINAAKVAYISLKERQMSRIPAQLSQNDAHEAIECIYPDSSSSQRNITVEGQSSRNPQSDDTHEAIEIIYPESSSSHSSITIDLEQILNLKDKVDSAQISTKRVEIKADNHSTTSSFNAGNAPGSSLNPENALGSSIQNGSSSSSPTAVLECLERAVTEQNADHANKTECTLLCNRIVVYPRKPDLNLPKGVTMLPISDDQWVAVSVDYTN